ncbi:MAG: hypothetical protein WBQ60_10645 [Asticcacaulis sp.]
MISALIMSATLLAQAEPVAAPAASPSESSRAAVDVESYQRNYEAPKSPEELKYDSGIAQAYDAKVDRSGRMQGTWVVSGMDGQKLVGLELRSDNQGKVEGAWRSMLAGFGMNNSGFVSDVDMKDRDLEVKYFVGKARNPTVMTFHREDNGQWRGQMVNDSGVTTPVTLTQVRLGS